MKGLLSPLNQQGATLIEAMIAIAILTIGILTVMVMQVSAINNRSSAMNRSEANGVALALLTWTMRALLAQAITLRTDMEMVI